MELEQGSEREKERERRNEREGVRNRQGMDKTLGTETRKERLWLIKCSYLPSGEKFASQCILTVRLASSQLL